MKYAICTSKANLSHRYPIKISFPDSYMKSVIFQSFVINVTLYFIYIYSFINISTYGDNYLRYNYKIRNTKYDGITY